MWFEPDLKETRMTCDYIGQMLGNGTVKYEPDLKETRMTCDYIGQMLGNETVKYEKI